MACAMLSLVAAVAVALSSVQADLVLDGGEAGWAQGAWNVQVDGVMGGKSTGTVRFDGGSMVFAGNINLDGGGFSSVRRTMNTADLSSYAGIVVELDAQVYSPWASYPLGVHLQLGDASSGYRYAAALAVPLSNTPGERAKVYLPMASFNHASWSGQWCSSCSLDASKVNAMEVYVLYQSGPFEVKMHAINAVMQAPSMPYAFPIISLSTGEVVANLIDSTIGSGAALYDQGYKGLCVAQYASSAHSIATATGSSAAVRTLACAGLVRAMRATGDEAEAEKAWILRRAFDAIVADVRGQSRKSDWSYPTVIRGDWLPATSVSEAAAGYSCDDIATEAVAPATMMSTSSMTTSSMSESFDGPFTGMGISGWNDLGLQQVINPLACAKMCLAESRCRSFDYGARQDVTGECWLSTATRASVGNAYRAWTHYDYYEVKPGAMASSSASSGMNDIGSYSQTKGKTKSESNKKDDEVSLPIPVVVGIAVAALVGIVVSLAGCLVLALRCRRRGQQESKQQSGAPQAGGPQESTQGPKFSDSDYYQQPGVVVVMGNPVPDNNSPNPCCDIETA